MSSHAFHIGAATVDLDRREVVHSDRTYALTALEVRLLSHLVERAGTVVSRDELLTEVWGYAPGVRTRAPHHAITRIRKKVEADPSKPVHLISVYGEGYRLDAINRPPPAPSSVVQPALNPQLKDRSTRFVGRKAELDRMGAWLESGTPLLAVVGPAGAGKTRLCCKFAQDRADAFPGGTWLVELEGLDSPELVTEALTTTLGFQGSAGTHSKSLAAALHARGPTLLVLDDLQFGGGFLAELLAGAPTLRVMVTSRRRLVLPHQQVLFLGALSAADATTLLRVRAQLSEHHRPRLEETGALEELIHSLDGLPLAIELAAPRLRVMGVDGLLARLADRFRLLRSRDGSVDSRKADLRAVLETSWRQLSPPIQLGLAHCSVFRGTFDLEAAEAVIDMSAWPGQMAAWDVLEALEDHSLLEVVGSARQRPRFRLLHSVRDLARELFAEEGAIRSPLEDPVCGPASVDAAHARHATYFARLGRSDRLPRLQTSDGRAAMLELHDARDELRLALAWSVSADRLALALPLAEASLEVVAARGGRDALESWIGRILAHDRLPTQDGVRLAARWARLRSKQGDWTTARAELEPWLVTARQHGSRREVAQVREALGTVELGAGNTVEARPHLEYAIEFAAEEGSSSIGLVAQLGLAQLEQLEGNIERSLQGFVRARRTFRRSGHARLEAMALCQIGTMDQQLGRLPLAHQRYVQVLEMARQIGARDVEVAAGGNLAGLLLELGQTIEAEQQFESNIELCRELGMPHIEGRALGNLATLYQARGDLLAAEEAYHRSIDLLETVQDPSMATVMRGNLAEGLMLQGRHTEAMEMMDVVIDALADGHAQWARGYFLGVAADVKARGGDLEGAMRAMDDAEELLRAEGRRVDLGKILCRRSSLLFDAGQRDEALQLLDEAAAIAAEIGATEDSELRGDIRRQRARLTERARRA